MTIRGVLTIACACAVGACTASLSGNSPGELPVREADAQQFIPPSFVLVTYAPRWRARVDDGVVLLGGPQRDRRLTVDSNEALFDGRAVLAHDGVGMLELRVTERLCIDPMSGAQLPYTGRLAVDGAAPVSGCGGPLSDMADVSDE